MWSENYKDCLKFIDNYWKEIIHSTSEQKILANKAKNSAMLLLPHDYISPNNKKFNYSFYWDTFFMFKGLLDSKHKKIMDKMIKNFIYLFEIYGIIPNYNSLAALNRTQPPLFTSMILDTYYYDLKRGERLGFFNSVINKKNITKLKKAINSAKNEYETVWIDKDNIYNHRVNGFYLAKYGDRDIGYAHTAEIESGWDFTSRFYNKCNHFLPVDLNSYLYKYECDFALISEKFHEIKEKESWQQKALTRKQQINSLLWNEKAGFFYDYNWFQNKQSEFLSLAGFIPLWTGMASNSQANKMLLKLSEFETDSGLTITAKKSNSKAVNLKLIPEIYHDAILDITAPKQWDYPNIWPPLEYLTIIGLLKYGFKTEAKRIMSNSVKTHAALFRRYGTFFEKINSITKEPGINFHYENQSGFGWTNAVFYRYIQLLDVLESGKSIYTDQKSENPPYDLAVNH